MNTAHDLGVIIRSRYPLVWIESADEREVLDLLRATARALGAPLYTWSVLDGLRRDGAAAIYGTAEPGRALASIQSLEGAGIFYLKDLERFLNDAGVLRHALDSLDSLSDERRAIVLAGPARSLPADLDPFCAALSLQAPSRDQLADLARRTLENLARREDVAVHLDRRLFPHVVDRLRGLSLFEAERQLTRLALQDRRFDDDDLDDLLAAKKRSLAGDGALELRDAAEIPELAGLEALREWVERRGAGFSRDAAEFGLEPPRGVLLLGVQGCGKTLAARWVAAKWQVPLLQLNVGALYDKYIGETEKRLERALRSAEGMAPCVLLVDEIEKTLVSGDTSDGGLSRRVQGRLLGWLQDRGAPVFVVATCNDVQALPPEMMRKGRFDEVFFVDLPALAERRAILSAHLRRRKRRPEDFDLWALAKASGGFSGAELEEAIVAALYAAFAEDGALATRHVMAEIAATRPLSVLRREELDALRSWASGRTVSASSRAPAA